MGDEKQSEPSLSKNRSGTVRGAKVGLEDVLQEIKEMRRELGEVLNEQKNIKKELSDVKDFQNLLSQKFDDIKNEQHLFREKFKEVRKAQDLMNEEIDELKKENVSLLKNLTEVKTTLLDLEQYSRNRNIEIHGIQEEEGENLKHIIMELGKQLCIPMEEKEIDVAHRLPLPKQSKGKRKAIIVQFTNRTIRDLWLGKRNTGLTSRNLVTGSDDTKIYVNVNLSKEKKKLCWEARQARKHLSYKYCWVNKQGDIFLQKSDTSGRLLVKTSNDLPKYTRIS